MVVVNGNIMDTGDGMSNTPSSERAHHTDAKRNFWSNEEEPSAIGNVGANAWSSTGSSAHQSLWDD